MKKILFKISSILFFLLNTPLAYAQNTGIGLNLKNQAGGIKITGNDNESVKLFGTVFQNIITLFFTIGALGFVIMIVWGGVDWILSGGDKEKIAGARKRIVTAITGLVILSLSFVAMTVVGQILGIAPLYEGSFDIPKLSQPSK